MIYSKLEHALNSIKRGYIGNDDYLLVLDASHNIKEYCTILYTTPMDCSINNFDKAIYMCDVKNKRFKTSRVKQIPIVKNAKHYCSEFSWYRSYYNIDKSSFIIYKSNAIKLIDLKELLNKYTSIEMFMMITELNQTIPYAEPYDSRIVVDKKYKWIVNIIEWLIESMIPTILLLLVIGIIPMLLVGNWTYLSWLIIFPIIGGQFIYAVCQSDSEQLKLYNKFIKIKK